MIKVQKYLIILSSIFIKTHSINLILLGTYSEPLIIIIKLNTSFTGTASAPPTFPSPRHLHDSLLYLLREQNTCFSFFWSRCIARNPSGVWNFDGSYMRYRTNVRMYPTPTTASQELERVRELRAYVCCIPACSTWLEEQSRGTERSTR